MAVTLSIPGMNCNLEMGGTPVIQILRQEDSMLLIQILRLEDTPLIRATVFAVRALEERRGYVCPLPVYPLFVSTSIPSQTLEPTSSRF